MSSTGRSHLALVTTVSVLLALLQLAPAGAMNASRLEPPITAVLVRSWGGCPPPTESLIWDELNSRWSDYGTTPIAIDYNHPQLCAGPITVEALASSGADVVILSDPAGGSQQYSAEEIAALQQYALEGHNIIGTYALFQWEGTDNRGLAPIFGLYADINYRVDILYTAYNLIDPASPLFAGMPDPYQGAGYPHSQAPDDSSWDPGDLNGAMIVAKTSDNKAAVMVYPRPTYHAIYITTMPEYYGDTTDERFLYNTIAYPPFSYSIFLRGWNTVYRVPLRFRS